MKTHNMQIKLTEEVWNGLKEKAAAAGLTVPSYIRWLIHSNTVSRVGVQALTGEVRKTEQHLEQLRKRAEAGDMPGPDELEQAFEKVREIERKIAEAYTG